MSKSHSLLRFTRSWPLKLSPTSSTCQTQLATPFTFQNSTRCLATVNAGPQLLPELWFTGSIPPNKNSPPEPNNSEKPPKNERTVKLGKTLRILQDRLPTLLQSPLPQEILSPQITLHLFPSTHPHLPTVSGRVAYAAALWTSPIAWGRVPLVGNVKLEILSERMSQSSSRGSNREQLIVRWKTIGKTKNKGTGGFYKGIGARENVDKITEWLGGGSGEDDSKEFTGLFLFEFDEEGRMWSHTIEHVQAEVAWKDYKNRVGPPGRFVLKLYAVSNTWLGLTDEEGGVHTLATQDDINYYNGEYDDIPPGHYDYKDMPEAEKNMNKRRVEIENRARARFRDSRLYSDELHKLVMDCLIVQQESRIHVEELYRATKRFKELWAEKVGLQAPLPYFPEPTVKDAKLPPPWNDLNREQGGGLGRPVPEYLESHELGVDDLFHATTQYEKAAMVRLWARRNPIDNPSDDDIRQALGVIDRNARHFITYNTTTGQYRGQRNRPVYEIPEAFPGGDFIKYDRTDEDDGYYGGGGGDLGHPSPQQKLLGIANPDPDSDAIPDHLKNVQSTPEHMKARYSKDTPPELRGGVPKAAGDLGGGLGGFVRMEVEKERLDQELGDQLRSRSGSSLPHRGADQRRERKKAQAELEAREREREQDEEERLRNWPVFPTGLQKSIDEALITHALELPELQNSVLFCTVTERQLVKGFIYLVGLTPSTTVLQMKEMLTEKETGVPVEDMKLMGNDRLTVFREFEDEELRSVICGVEIFVCDITKMGD